MSNNALSTLAVFVFFLSSVCVCCLLLGWRRVLLPRILISWIIKLYNTYIRMSIIIQSDGWIGCQSRVVGTGIIGVNNKLIF